MAPVCIKFVVSFTSQDECHKVSNLTDSDGFKRWLSNPKDKSGQIEAVFQLDNGCVISYIDVGVHWCASLEIQVGQSDWPQDKTYVTLLPTVSFMNPLECRSGHNPTRSRMFGTDDFSEDTHSKKWDRVKVVCRQPYRKDVQYGLSFLRIRSNDSTEKRSLNSISPNIKSVESIQKHFFGQANSSTHSEDKLKSRLMKIAGSSENGTEHHHAVPRTAKLVLAASDGNKTPKSHHSLNRPALYSSHLIQKYGPQVITLDKLFDDEAAEFLSTFKIDENELDKITIADIRHKFEKTKKRKLTSEEKKVFVKQASDHICKMFGNENANKPQTKVTNGHVTTVTNDHTSSRTNDHLSNEKILTTASNKKSNKYGYDWKRETTTSIATKTDSEACFTKSSLKKIETFSSPMSSANSPVNRSHIDSTKDEWLSSVNHDTNQIACNGSGKGARKRLLKSDTPTSGRGKRSRRCVEIDDVGIINSKEQAANKQKGRGRKNSGRGRIRGQGRKKAALSPAEQCTGNQLQQNNCGLNSPTSLETRCDFDQKTSINNLTSVEHIQTSSDCIITHVQTDSDYTSEKFVECPICSEFFSKDGIEFHAAICSELNFN